MYQKTKISSILSFSSRRRNHCHSKLVEELIVILILPKNTPCHSELAEELIVIQNPPKNTFVILSLPKNKERALLFISTAAEKSIFGNCSEYTKTCLHTE